MALFVLQPGLQSFSHDFLDTDQASVLGGEIATWDEASRTNTTTEKAAYDARDGYVSDEIDTGVPTASRPILRLADSSGSDDAKAFYLIDEGTKYYGTLFGEVIGNPVGLTFTSTNLGPHSMAGSGKVTAYDKPGLYAVSLDAVHSSTSVVNGGLAAGLDTPLPGDLLYRHQSNAKIARLATAGGTTGSNEIGIFIEMSGPNSLVTTPPRLVGASEVFDRVKFNFLGFSHNL